MHREVEYRFEYFIRETCEKVEGVSTSTDRGKIGSKKTCQRRVQCIKLVAVSPTTSVSNEHEMF